MDRTLAEMPVIDIDSHYTEPRDLWTSRAPADLRDDVPRVVELDGKEMWVMGRDTFMGPLGFCVVKKDGGKIRGEYSLPRYEEMTEAATYPKPRLEVMDQLGLDVQILYPNILGFAGSSVMKLENAALRNLCVTAYNDAVAELQAEGAGRLFPQAILPFWDLDLAVKELERCRKRGLTGFTMTDAPEQWSLPCLSEPYWDKLWGTAQEMGLPVNFHIGSGSMGGGPWTGMGQSRTLATISTMLFMNNMRCLTNLIFSGLLDRFPTLKFVSVESGIGWIPFLIEACEYQMDENLVDRGGLELRPREYFARQMFASFWFERGNVAHTLGLLGENNVMFETDFPHPTCLYPNVQEQIQTCLGGLDRRVQRKVLYETAARVYQLPEPTKKLARVPGDPDGLR